MTFFLSKKNNLNWKIREKDLLARLKPGQVAIAPLVVKKFSLDETKSDVDARVTLGLPGEAARFHFVVEAKSRSTPLIVRNAIAQARAAARKDEHSMIMVPYLSDERLRELEREQVSGIDLCGNGIVIVPRRLYLLRTGQPNLYPDSRPLSNPYAGRSAMAARILLTQSNWSSLNEIASAIKKEGGQLSLAQISKALSAMEEDATILRDAGKVTVPDRMILLDYLARNWKVPRYAARQALRLPANYDWAKKLSEVDGIRWAVTGESSVSRYTTFAEQGPVRIAVSNLQRAMYRFDGKLERIPNFAQIELLETEEPVFFFQNEKEEKGTRWASRLQAWLELQRGDGRQQDAAGEIRKQLLKRNYE